MNSNQQERLAYFAGPVATDEFGIGWYMVIRVDGKMVRYFVRNNRIAENYEFMELSRNWKHVRTYVAPTAILPDTAYDYSQISEEWYDICKCGNPKAAARRRCPICYADRRARRAAFAEKVIAQYKAHQRALRSQKRRAAKQAARQAKRQAEDDKAWQSLRSSVTGQPSQDDAAMAVADKMWNWVKSLFPRREAKVVQLSMFD